MIWVPYSRTPALCYAEAENPANAVSRERYCCGATRVHLSKHALALERLPPALNRHELKEQIRHDQFTDSISSIVHYTSTHRQQVTRWAIIAGAVLIAVAGVMWFSSSRTAARQSDLQSALTVVEAPVGQPSAVGKSFSTQDEKNKAGLKALAGVVSQHGGTREGLIAQYYLGTLKAQTGYAKGAESDLKNVAASGNECSTLAKIALAQLYAGQNKLSEAQGYLREIVNKPTDLVSKAQAQLLLAELIQPSKPAEAKKIFQSLKAPGQSPAVTRAAEQLSGSSQK